MQRGSYAGDVIKRVYQYYFGDATSIRKEYKRCYKNEYNDYIDYIICHFNVPKDIAKAICKKNVFYVDLNSRGEHIADHFLYDEELKEQYWNLVGGVENENTNRIRDEQFFN